MGHITARVTASICRGPNRACAAAARQGRQVHVIPERGDVYTEPALVMPTYHYQTSDEGIIAIAEAAENAPTVTCDEDLYRFRKAGVAHFLPVGWVDPTMRRAECPGTPHRGHASGPCCPMWKMWCSSCKVGGHVCN